MMKKATIDDLKRLYRVILECSSWLKSKNIKQWIPVYPKALFKKDIKNGNVFYFIEKSEIIGTVTLSGGKPHYYPEDFWNDKAKVWYMMRFAVPRNLKNKKIGDKLISLIENNALTAKKERIRLDVPKSNPFLKEYYIKRGFIPILECNLRETPSLLLEKTLYKG